MGDIQKPDVDNINVGSITEEINDSNPVEIGAGYYNKGENFINEEE